MNFIDEVKLAWFLKGLPAQLENAVNKGDNKMGAKISALLGKLDGLKSVLGLLMIVAYYVAPHFHLSIPDVVLKIGTGFASVGLAMKLEKGLGILTKVIEYGQKALAVLQAVVNVLAAKLPAEQPK